MDYQPIYETAQTALSALAGCANVNIILQRLGEDVGRVKRNARGHHDLLGRIFHRVLDTARYDGSFYTSSAAATLLASLALPNDREWDHDAVADLRICDPACGTGTLLMAAAERLNHLVKGDTEQDDELDAMLAQLLVEDVLYGYDTNLTATHMSAVALGMLRPETKFESMHVNRTKFGMLPDREGNLVPRLGSLEWLDTGDDGKQEQRILLEPWPSPVATNIVTGEDEEAPPSMDLVIMNPPFTRDSLRHDQMGEDAERAIKEREKQLLAKKEYRKATRLHSSGGMFTVLGTQMLKANGALAMVLPTVVATAPGNADMRQYLADAIHIEIVVSSHDPKRIFFSENTNIGELLIIGRRWNSNKPKPDTRFINLNRNPRTSIEAMTLLRALDNDERIGFTEQHVEAARMEQGDWYAVNFYSPMLVREYRGMAEGLVRLDSVAKIGPSGRRIRDSYRKVEQPTALGRRALWHHKADVVTSMRAETDTYIEPKAAKAHLAEHYWDQRARLLLPARLSLPSIRMMSVRLDDPTIGSLWQPCRPHDERDERALVVWFNSTPGILSMLAERDNKKPVYPAFSIDSQRALRVPVFTDESRDVLATAFEEMKDQQLRTLPDMTNDPVRKRLDDVVADALGYDREWIAGIRRELSREPSITNVPLYDDDTKQGGLL